MKKYFLILLFLITGCTNYTDLNNLSIIKSIGISYSNETYFLYAELIDEVIDNNPKTKIIKTKDNDIHNLFNELKRLNNREISFTHIDLLVLDYTIHDKNYYDIINFFIKNREFRNDFFCILTDDINKVLKSTKFNEVENLLNTNKRTIKLSFLELAKNYLDKKAFYISSLSINQEIELNGNYYYSQNNYERVNDEKR